MFNTCLQLRTSGENSGFSCDCVIFYGQQAKYDRREANSASDHGEEATVSVFVLSSPVTSGRIGGKSKQLDDPINNQ